MSTCFAHVAPDGSLQPYSSAENVKILEAMLGGHGAVALDPIRLPTGLEARFEIRFGPNAVSDRMREPPSSGMIQVNLDTENTRVVQRVQPKPSTVEAASAAPVPCMHARFAHISPTGQRQLYSDTDNALIHEARAKGLPSVRVSDVALAGGAVMQCV